MFFEGEYGCITAFDYGSIILEGRDNFRNRSHEEISTHTEDGVPIQKLYVTNLPPNITKHDLIKAFNRFGHVQQCVLRFHGGRRAEGVAASDNPPLNQQLRAGYAFITFSTAEDAYSALCAGRSNEVMARGRLLIVRPADTWHQPQPLPLSSAPTSTPPQPQATDTIDSNLTQETDESEVSPTILDILDRDCMQIILAYLTLPDLVRSERVCKSWQEAVQESLYALRRLSTSHWQCSPTTAALRAALIRCGDTLRELSLDADPSHKLNGRTFKMVSRFCPRLEVLSAHGSLESGGAAGKAALANLSHLRSLTLSACPRLDDSVLFPLLHRTEQPLLKLRLEGDLRVNGVCFTNSNEGSLALEQLALSSMIGLRGSFLLMAAPRFAALRELEFDLLPESCWKCLPAALRALPSPSLLQNLSLLRSPDINSMLARELANALAGCTGLKRLRLWYNWLVRDSILETVSRAARGLEWLEVCNCQNITAPALADTLCRLEALQTLNLSHMLFCPTDTCGSVLTAIAGLPHLKTIRLKDNSQMKSEELIELVKTCPSLRELDVRGTIGADSNLLQTVVEHCQSLEDAPLTLRLARTSILPECSPPDDECRRLRLRLDWQDCSPAVYESHHLQSMLRDPDYDGLEDDDSYEDAFLDAMSDLFSASDSDDDLIPEEHLLMLEDMRLRLFPRL